jgi:hypothetical protein
MAKYRIEFKEDGDRPEAIMETEINEITYNGTFFCFLRDGEAYGIYPVERIKGFSVIK